MAFSADVRHPDGVAVMELHGDIDGGADEGIHAAYEQAIATGPTHVLLNFDDVSYINSTGIALIVGVLAQARGADRTILACGLTDHYKEIFEITRIADFVAMFDTETEAVTAAGQGT
ncbi:MAG: STAS domain-containing protein [Actinomycetota bacterium]